ncbi:MAG: NHLP leader peptide family RiPP precursor, partial [Phycisphaerales bacterium]|nr:NHLP leader peptide family RiPP precursor [Phycisphaerales bacterium]
MTEERNALTDLFAACWKDEALKQRFMADPKAVLAEYGMDVPDGMNLNVVENGDTTVHITMP